MKEVEELTEIMTNGQFKSYISLVLKELNAIIAKMQAGTEKTELEELAANLQQSLER